MPILKSKGDVQSRSSNRKRQTMKTLERVVRVRLEEEEMTCEQQCG